MSIAVDFAGRRPSRGHRLAPARSRRRFPRTGGHRPACAERLGQARSWMPVVSQVVDCVVTVEKLCHNPVKRACGRRGIADDIVSADSSSQKTPWGRADRWPGDGDLDPWTISSDELPEQMRVRRQVTTAMPTRHRPVSGRCCAARKSLPEIRAPYPIWPGLGHQRLWASPDAHIRCVHRQALLAHIAREQRRSAGDAFARPRRRGALRPGRPMSISATSFNVHGEVISSGGRSCPCSPTPIGSRRSIAVRCRWRTSPVEEMRVRPAVCRSDRPARGARNSAQRGRASAFDPRTLDRGRYLEWRRRRSIVHGGHRSAPFAPT